ncbi:MAG: PepSY domain-containing protein [Proteobacteria bacterium]|nr:PepSY domain-containing protein [Pseudomonadota bacterium]
MRRTSLVIALAFPFILASPFAAFAGWFTEESPPANAKPLSEIIKGLEDQGYKTITEVAFDDGQWEIEVHQAGGKEVDLKVDAMTGQIVGK